MDRSPIQIKNFPRGLWQRVKARAALRGQLVREFVVEALEERLKATEPKV